LTQKKYLSPSNIFIFVFLFILTAGQFLPVEIDNGLLRFLVYAFILIGLPILLYKKFKILTGKLKNPYLKITIRLFLFGFIGFYLLIFLLFGVGKTMCSYSTVKTLYVRKGFSFSSIIVRDFGCGAYDSDMPKYEIVNRIDIFSLIQISPSIDTSTINKNNWIKVETKDR
jgi:hypothetical protein